MVSIGLYKKSLAFWTTVFALIGGVAYLINHPLGIPVTTAEHKISFDLPAGGGAQYKVVIQQNGATFINGKPTRQTIFPSQRLDHFRLKVLDENPEQFDAVTVTLTLPAPIDSAVVNAQGLIIHSYTSAVDVKQKDAQTVVFTAYDVAPNAVFTITADFPKNYFALPFGAKIKSQLATLPAPLWLAAGLLAPLVGAALAVVQLARRARLAAHLRAAPIVSNPPSNLPAAVVGALQRGAISNSELAATVVDLAVHDSVYIFAKTTGEFTFAKTQLEPTRGFEKALLSKIFYERQSFSRRADVLYRVGHRVFSQKVALFYLEVYRQLEQGGYFLEPPGKIIYRWRLAGAGLFFAGIAGFFLGVFFFPEPKFPLALWLGVIGLSFLINRFAPLAVRYSTKGLTTVKSWTGFKKYLALTTPVSYQGTQDNRMFRYLPYAVVFGVQRRWLGRFANYPFTPPKWFDSNERAVGLDRFGQLLMPITGYVSRLLAASREPTV